MIQVAVHAGCVRQENVPKRFQALPDTGARHLLAPADGLTDVHLQLGKGALHGGGIDRNEAQLAGVVGRGTEAHRNLLTEDLPQHSQHQRVAAGQIRIDPQEKGETVRVLFKAAQQRHALLHRGRAVRVDLLQPVHRFVLRG